MALKLELLELVEGEKIVDAGAASQRIEATHHIWVQEQKPRKYKINLSKASAAEIMKLKSNIGGTVLMDVGEMMQQGSFALYFKIGGDIDVLIPPPPIPTSQVTELENEPEAENKPVPSPMVAAAIPPKTDKTDTPNTTTGTIQRPPQPTPK